MERTTYRFPPGVEQVRFGVDASVEMPAILEELDYKRAFILTSKTLNTTTGVVDRIAVSIDSRLVGRTDEIGEHSPIKNVLKGISSAQDVAADVLVVIGGGSALDFAKFVQLGVSEKVESRAQLRALAPWDGGTQSRKAPALRQIAIPTTFSTAEWTGGGTPVDETTGRKIMLSVPRGAPQVIVYDTDIVARTPRRLLLATGIRGLDHAINTACSTNPNTFSTAMALQAIRLYYKNLPRLAADSSDRVALAECQRATWFAGLGQGTTTHGFSHYMVHVIAPWAHIGHSDAACVMTLAQARWFGGQADQAMRQVAEAMGNADASLDMLLEDLLTRLSLPTTLRDLGINLVETDDLVQRALEHPHVTRHNLRPIETEADLRSVLALVA